MEAEKGGCVQLRLAGWKAGRGPGGTAQSGERGEEQG